MVKARKTKKAEPKLAVVESDTSKVNTVKAMTALTAAKLPVASLALVDEHPPMPGHAFVRLDGQIVRIEWSGHGVPDSATIDKVADILAKNCTPACKYPQVL